MVTNMCSRLQLCQKMAFLKTSYKACVFSYIAALVLLAWKVLLSECELQRSSSKGAMNYNLEAGIGNKSYRVPKRAWMIAFAIGWGLLTILVVMQDHAIDTQRELIQ